MGYLKRHTGKKIVAQALALAMCVTTLQSVPVSYAAGETNITVWDFEDQSQGTQGWTVNTGWIGDENNQETDFKNTLNLERDESGRLKYSLDFSKVAYENHKGWAQAAFNLSDCSNISFAGINKLSFDFYYKKSKSENENWDGSLTVKLQAKAGETNIIVTDPASDNGGLKDCVDVLFDDSADANGLIKKSISFEFDESKIGTNQASDVTLVVVGRSTNYSGCVYFDNITLNKSSQTEPKDAKEWTFSNNEGIEDWEVNTGWSGGTDGDDYRQSLSLSGEKEKLKFNLDYSKFAGNDKSWVQAAINLKECGNLELENLKKLSFDFYYKEPVNGNLKIKVSSTTDYNNNLIQNDTISITNNSDLKSELATDVGESWKKTNLVFDFKEAEGKIVDLIFLVVGDNSDYSDGVYFDNIKLEKSKSESAEKPTNNQMPSEWTFDSANEVSDWKDLSWSTAVKSITWDESGRLKANIDFTGLTNWPTAGIKYEGDGKGLDMSPYKSLSFELYYKDSDRNGESFNVKVMAEKGSDKVLSGEINISDEGRDDLKKEELADGWIKAIIQVDIDAALAKTVKPDNMAIAITGDKVAYNGDIFIDNIKFSEEAIDRGYVNSTQTVKTNTKASTTETGLTINDESKQYVNSIKLVDSDADQATKALYQYLKAVGESSSVIYGHMEDTVLKAGSLGEGFTYSDTADVTGSISAIDGLDCGNLFDGFAKKYVDRYGENKGITVDDTTFADDVKAAALLSNESIKKGAIMTLSSHLPNFAYAELKEGTYEHAYDKYKYPVDSYNTTGDCMNNILPGGKFNDAYISYLDLIAEYAHQVNGPILFRPLHENTGSWFWWGKAFCNAETYKSVFKYTVDYLRDEKGVHNFLYLYGPGSEAGSEAEYEERYPGDNYVDMVGFDSYDARPSDDANYAFMKNFENTVKLTNSFAKNHNKLFAVTETGISNGNLGLLPKNNPRKDWYMEILDIVTKSDYNCCYFMLWSNYSSSASYYTPFVINKNDDGTLFGHEMLDSFIKFYNDQRSIFANDQTDIINKFSIITEPSVAEKEIDGYITSPVANSRILEVTNIMARINMATNKTVSMRVSGNDKTIDLATTKDSTGKVYTATLTKESLDALGETSDGKIGLYIDGKLCQEISVIFNIEEKVMLPEQVDDFESYGGLANLLTGKWATNNDSGCTIDLSLVKDPCYEGEYALKITYNETKTGWAGATIPKEADWSAYDALKFWVKPDGKNQKTVVQITVGKTAYEAYLNLYSEYASASTPLLVTLPFSEFKNSSGDVLTSEALKNMSGFGLWVNAIGDSAAFANGEETVSGELYYDDIRAVSAGTDKPIFEVANGKKPEEDNKPSEENKYAVTFDTSAVKNVTVSIKKDEQEFKSGDSAGMSDKLQLIITPNNNYVFSEVPVVKADNASVGAAVSKDGKYTFIIHSFRAASNVTVNCIAVEKQFEIALSDGVNDYIKNHLYITATLDFTEVTANSTTKLIITPKDGYSITFAEAKVGKNTCKVSKAEKTANGVYVITFSDFTDNTVVDSLTVNTEEAKVRENGTTVETNVGEANLSKTEFKDIQEDIKNDVNAAFKELEDNTLDETEKAKAVEAQNAIINNKALIEMALKVDEKFGDITSDEKKENDIQIEEIKKESQKIDNSATVEVKAAITLDISLFSVCKYIDSKKEIARVALSKLTKPVKISMKLPANIPVVKNGAVRTYYIICLHKNKNGKIESSKVKCDYDKDSDIISFDGSKFSTYVLCYADVTSKSTNTPSSGGSTISGGGTSVVLGSVTSTPVPTATPTAKPGTSASAAPSATVTPVPSSTPSATNAPSVTSKPSQTEQPSDEPGTSTSKVKKGTKFITKGITYRVTSVSGTKTVTCVSGKKNIKKAVVPASVKINGKKYKVTVIAKNAFKDNKKLTKVTIGKNVQSIGKNAFKGCKNLKKIVVKTKKLTAKKVGSNAFKGINSKAVVKVPKNKVKAYKKIIKAKGAGKKVEVTK